MKFKELRKRGLCFAIAAMMTLNSSMVAFAEPADGDAPAAPSTPASEPASAPSTQSTETTTSTSTTSSEVKESASAASTAESTASTEAASDKKYVENGDKSTVNTIATQESTASTDTDNAVKDLEAAEGTVQAGKDEIAAGNSVTVPVTAPVLDADGNQVMEEVTDAEGNVTQVPSRQPVYETDAEGNPVYVQQTDEKGNPVTDEEGNPVYVTDAEGNPVRKQATQSVDLSNMYEKDAEGNLVYEVETDESGNVILYVDAEGNKIPKLKLDEEGNPIPVKAQGYLEAVEYMQQQAAQNAANAAQSAVDAMNAANAAGSAADIATTTGSEAEANAAVGDALNASNAAAADAATAEAEKEAAYQNYETAKAAYEAAQKIADEKMEIANKKLADGAEDAKKALEEAKAAYDSANALKTAYDTAAETAKQTKEDKEKELADTQKELADIRDQITTSTGNVVDLTEAAVKADTAVGSLKGIIAGEVIDVTKAESQLIQAKKDLKKANEELEKANERLAALEKDATDTTDATTAISIRDALRAQLDAIEDQITTAEEALQQLKDADAADYAQKIKDAADEVNKYEWNTEDYWAATDAMNELVLKHQISKETGVAEADITLSWDEGIRANDGSNNYLVVTYTDKDGKECKEFYNYDAADESDNRDELNIVKRNVTITTTYSDTDGKILSQVATDSNGNLITAGEIIVGDDTYVINSKEEPIEVPYKEYTYVVTAESSETKQVPGNEKDKIKEEWSFDDGITYYYYPDARYVEGKHGGGYWVYEGECMEVSYKWNSTTHKREPYYTVTTPAVTNTVDSDAEGVVVNGNTITINGVSYTISDSQDLTKPGTTTVYYYTVETDRTRWEEEKVGTNYSYEVVTENTTTATKWVDEVKGYDKRTVNGQLQIKVNGKWYDAVEKKNNKGWKYYEYSVVTSVTRTTEYLNTTQVTAGTYEVSKEGGRTYITINGKKYEVKGETDVKQLVEKSYTEYNDVNVDFSSFTGNTRTEVTDGGSYTSSHTSDYINWLNLKAQASSKDAELQTAKQKYEDAKKKYDDLLAIKNSNGGAWGKQSAAQTRKDNLEIQISEAWKKIAADRIELDKKKEEAREAHKKLSDETKKLAALTQKAIDLDVKINGIKIPTMFGQLVIQKGLKDDVTEAKAAYNKAVTQQGYVNELVAAAKDAYEKADKFAKDYNNLLLEGVLSKTELAAMQQQVDDAYNAYIIAQMAADAAVESAEEAYQEYLRAQASLDRFNVEDTFRGGAPTGGYTVIPTTVAPATAPTVAIPEVPVALADAVPADDTATPAVRGARRGTGVVVDDTTTILDEAVAQADTLPEITASTSLEETANKTIEDEETALADSIQETKGFGWWWLLIVAAIGTGSYAGYRQYKKNKEEDAEIQ